MKKVSLSGSKRENVGKKDAKLLRREGLVPCVVYGGAEQTYLSVSATELDKLIYTPEVFEIELNIEGSSYRTIMKDVQFDPVSDKAVHVDFLEVNSEKKIKSKLPIKIVGTSDGVRMGGSMVVFFRKVNVFGNIDAFPENVTLDISKLEIGDDIRISDINVEGVTVNEAPTAVMVSVKASRTSIKAAEEEGAEVATAEA
jgi:large subunit ribosomal protein L25